MKWIRVVTDKGEVYDLRLEHIIGVRERKEGGAEILLSSGVNLDVKESREEILEQIGAAERRKFPTAGFTA